MKQFKTVLKERAKDEEKLKEILLDRLMALQPLGERAGFEGDDIKTLNGRVAAFEQMEAQKIIRAYQAGPQDKRALSNALGQLLELAAHPLHRHLAVPKASGRIVDYTPAFDAREQARDIINMGLKTIRNVPSVIGDDAPSDSPRRLWMVNPLEGIDHDDAVMSIALIDNGRPVAGVLHFLKKGSTYAGVPGEFASLKMRGRKPVDISVRSPELYGKGKFLGAIAATAHGARDFQAFRNLRDAQNVKRVFGEAAAPYGLCRLAQGSLNLYFQPHPLPQGTLAAAHAVLEGAGGVALTLKGAPLTFARGGAGTSVSPFIATADRKPLKEHETTRLVV